MKSHRNHLVSSIYVSSPYLGPYSISGTILQGGVPSEWLYDVCLYDMSGQLIRIVQQDLATGEYTFEHLKLPPENYFVVAFGSLNHWPWCPTVMPAMIPGYQAP